MYYWVEDKIKSDGSHSGKWIKGKLVSVDGSMVGVDLGTRIVKVNVSKIRKDRVDVPLDPVGLHAEHSAMSDVSQRKTCSVSLADLGA